MHSTSLNTSTAQTTSLSSPRILQICEALMWISAALCAAWFVLYMTLGYRVAAVSVGVLGLAMVTSLLMLKAGMVQAGLLFSQITSYIFVCHFALCFDIPDADTPRILHIYLLVIALVGYVNYQRQRSWLQIGIIAACLAGFVFFASSNFSIPAATPISGTVRGPLAIINAGILTTLFSGIVVVLQTNAAEQGGLVRELLLGVSRGEFELFYQPQVDRGGRTIGAEALLRWQHPKRGYISPAEFIPLAERSGIMPKIGSWVLKEACQTLSAWNANASTRHLTLAINITADQFLLTDFVQLVEGTVRTYGVDPKRLKLELTESVFVADVEGLAAKMTALQDIGIGISLDDFGTGYSSLSYLRRLPLTQLKIDRSFVRGVSENELDASLAKTIVQMGHDLSLDVLAEGVETEAQYRFMLDCGCSALQGYYFGRPMTLADFELRVPTTI
ncbi:putative bifunctional diguanylate cyclase/phosphodiesterase [Rhizobium sp. PAMB 3182]